MSPSAFTRPVAVAAALALVAASLSGCTSDEEGQVSPSGSPAASSPSSSQRTAAAGDLAGQAMVQAGSLAASKSTTVDCSSGAAQVSQDGAVVRIKGECTKLTVSAIGALVIADSIGSLDVTGTGVAVATGSLKRLSISSTGTGTMISYAGTPPTVDDRGSGSAVSSDPLTD